MDFNPLFTFEPSVHADSSSSASVADLDDHGGRRESLPQQQPPPVSSLQMVNIKTHVPTVLDIVNPNYPEWRCFFDSVIGKFGLQSHIAAAPTAALPYVIWSAIVDLFRDHQLHRAVYLEAEFRSLYQGDLSITDYTAKLKELADTLRDLGQPVSEPSQVLNMLRGLNGKYRHTISAITSRQPPHTFLSARSFLLLEELYDSQHGKMAAHHAMVAQSGTRQPPGGVGSSGTGGSGQGGSSNPAGGFGASYGGNRSKKRRGRGNGNPGGSQSLATAGGSSSSTQRPVFPNTPWAAGFNPWQGMVQAWPMPFRAPAAGVLGPRPGTPNQQAFIAGTPSFPSGTHAGLNAAPSGWEPNSLLAALASAGVPPAGNSSSDWFLDTGASSHMASAPGNLHSLRPLSSSPSVTFRLPILALQTDNGREFDNYALRKYF
ncbi:uncharacterized protein LOC133917779 [Phragmites australis]|uniref:uncharacterized protein LOC133917779 n=1 Tax=Phragmites australis TaxID=29695 RepID=UPI002D797301|nr:uncharacterized protein LOC133917779 [Phragmites australis]